MTNQTVSMSEFKRNPAAVLKSANNRPVVLSRLAEQDDAVAASAGLPLDLHRSRRGADRVGIDN